VANDELILGAEFPTADRADWLELVDKVLKGAPFDRRLVTTTYEGLQVQPLYTRADAPGSDAAGSPGDDPFLRGGRAEGNVVDGWDVRQYHAGTDLAALNAAILTDLERGVRSIVLGPSGIDTVDQLDRALDGVYLDIAPICLDWGPDSGRGADLLAALWERRGLPDSAAVGELGLDPLGCLARNGWSAAPVAAELQSLGERAAANAARRPGVRAARVDATVYADGGGSDALEVAAALATGVAYVRAMVDAGLDADAAFGQIAFRLTADADQFATMAKLRAARRCWARIAEASGAAGAAMSLHAVTARAMYSRRDAWVNLLRATLACFAAAAAGADAITVLPFGAAAGQWDELGVRLARNTQIILAEESGVHRVVDPAGGSYYVEQRSDELAADAWRRFQAIEAAGGMAAALTSGSLAAEAAETWTARRANLARRKDALTGVSEFPNLDEDELIVAGDLDPAVEAPADAAVRIERIALRRLAAPFEELRDRADRLAATAAGRPTVFLANLGPVATHTARATFAKNFFEVGGIRALGNDGFAGPAEAAAAFAASGSTRAVICSSDAVYAEQAAAAATALKAAGATTVYLAGNPGDAKAAYEAAGIDEFVFVGCDLLDVLDRALAG